MIDTENQNGGSTEVIKPDNQALLREASDATSNFIICIIAVSALRCFSTTVEEDHLLATEFDGDGRDFPSGPGTTSLERKLALPQAYARLRRKRINTSPLATLM